MSLVAGLGCRRGVGGEAVLAAVDAALAAHGRSRAELALLATGAGKCEEPGFQTAAAALGLPLRGVGEAALAACNARAPTHSPRSLAETGAASLSECAALAAAGQGARLLGARLALGPVTCALAEMTEERP